MPEGNNRPNQPTGGRHGNPPSIIARNLPNHGGKYANAPATTLLPLALHHVIPWEHLWKFWNEMVRNKYYSAARDFLAILGLAKPTTKDAFDAIAKGCYLNAQWGFDVRICWAEWNLVRGPEFRVKGDGPEEDPGPNVDDMHWMASKDSKRLESLVKLDELILGYTTTLPREKDLSGYIRSWSGLARNQIVEFEAAMWKLPATARDYVPSDPTTHSIPLHPEWLKRRR